MERRLIIRIFLVSAVAAAGTWVLVPSFQRLIQKTSSESVEVLVATHYLSAFSTVRPSDVRIEETPKGFVPPGALNRLNELTNQTGQPVYISAVAIPEGQPLTRTIVVNAEEGESLARLIRPGKVAVSFEVDRAHGVGGWVKPGDLIALFQTVARPNAQKQTELLLPSIPVLAVDTARLGQRMEKPQSSEDMVPPEMMNTNDAKILTVLVSPSEAHRIVEARERGSLNVALRAIGDELPWPNLQ